MRVYELARELGKEPKDLIAHMRKLGILNKQSMSGLEPDEIERIKKSFLEEKEKAEQAGIIEKRVKNGVIRRRIIKPKEEAKPEEVKEPKPPAVKEKPSVIRRVKPAPVSPAKQEPEPQLKKESVVQAETEVKPEPKVKEQTAELKKLILEPEKIARKPLPKRRYIKPTVRRTARAADEIPSPAVLEAEEKKEVKEKKKDKKKRLVLQKEIEEREQGRKIKLEPAKKKLRRKIAFKLEQSALMEGMELIDMERIYIPAKKKPIMKKRAFQKTQITVPKPHKRIIKMGETIAVNELAKRIGVKVQEVLNHLSSHGINVEPSASIDYETSALIAQEFQYEVQKEVFEEAKILQFPKIKEEVKLEPRPPVVTVMGHVDHGKTTLLDHIRRTRVAEKELGGITQHIGASVIKTDSGDVVFIDTPGHEAFTAMRARGAQVTDLVVLVVAADDGVMPQTVEAINHAKAANVPIVVAINKMDLKGVNPDKVKQKLAEYGLVPEEWGGETLMVPCSARTGQGIKELMEAILLQAELLELKANPKTRARGVVIESRLDRGKGAVATVIVKEGTLYRGDIVVCGTSSGKIRGLFDDQGKPLNEVKAGYPAEVIGLDEVPQAGDELLVVDDERKARLVIEHRLEEKRKQTASSLERPSIEELLTKTEDQKIEINLIVKADTYGSVEAVKEAIAKIATENIQFKFLHTDVGAITENDVLLATASKALLIGFGVRAEPNAQKLIEREKVEVMFHRIIYELIDELDTKIKKRLGPKVLEKITGRVEIRQIFNIPRIGVIGGCYVVEGSVARGSRIRLLRDNVVVYDGRIASLKRFKDDVKEVGTGLECGIGLENFQDLKPGDILEVYTLEEQS